MTLSRPGCARLWESAQADRPGEWEGRYACLTCPVGAKHAGRSLVPMAAIVEGLRKVCPRCARLTDRLIKGRLCVSCYNRDREVMIGKNAKGNRPTLELVPVSLVARDARGSRTIRAPHVTGFQEIILHATKKAEVFLAFGRPPVVWRVPARAQLELRGLDDYGRRSGRPRPRHPLPVVIPGQAEIAF